jgi:hypothetical protein
MLLQIRKVSYISYELGFDVMYALPDYLIITYTMVILESSARHQNQHSIPYCRLA